MSKSRSMQEKHPEFFTPDLHINPRMRTRTIPFQAISARFSRTGTACENPVLSYPIDKILIKDPAVSAALYMLGIPCFHSLHFFSNIRDCDKWNEALDAKLYNKGKPFTRTQ